MQWTRDPYTVSCDPTRLDRTVIANFLASSYWAGGIPRATVDKSIEHALCFGVFEGQRQIGFARVVTDYATFAYLADVFVLEEHRGRGLGEWLIECVVGHPELQGLRRWVLATRDAHPLYAKFGFTPLKSPERFMELHDPHVYDAATHSGGR